MAVKNSTQQTEHLTVTIAEAKTRVLRCLRKKRPIFLWGAPGIGKSDSIAQITEALGDSVMLDFRLGTRQPTDIIGIPFYNKETGQMDWAPPVDLPTSEFAAQYKYVVLFLDELTSAAPAVQAAAYQLVLSRRVNKYILPDNVLIVAAGNRESDRGVTYRMPTPLANRFVHLEVRHDFDAWFAWAVNNDINTDVIGYLTFAKNDLFDFDPKSSGHAFATPRSWCFVSELIGDNDIQDDELRDLVTGTVGEGISSKFMAHRKFAKDLPNPTDILSGKVTTLATKEISAKYSLIISLCYELKTSVTNKVAEKVFNEMSENFLSFLMNNFDTELVIMGARLALVNYSLPFKYSKMKSYTEFHTRYGKYILAAVSNK